MPDLPSRGAALVLGLQEAVPWLLPTAAAVSAATVLITLLGLPWVLTRLPADWFVAPPAPGPWTIRRIARNALGALLIVAGLAMLVLPGQGLLTILAGLVLTDVPGKRRLELALLRRRPIRRAVDALRRRRGRPPFRLPGDDVPP